MKSQTDNKQPDQISQYPTISSISSSRVMDLSLSFSTQSTQSIILPQISSIPQQKQLPIQFHSPIKNTPNQSYLDCTIEKPRLNYQQQNQFNDGLQEYTGFIGFVQAGKQKPIHINESKMKKAAEFFNDTPFKCEENKKYVESESEEQEQSKDGCSLLDVFEQKKENKSSKNTQHEGSFSCGFMNAKTGSTISINKDLAQKAKLLLDDEPAQYSEKKPTKFKGPKMSNSSSLLKTVTWQQKKMKGGNKRKVQESKEKKILGEISIEKLSAKYEKIRISELPEVDAQQLIRFQQFWTNFECFKQNFVHNHRQCQMVSCYFCKKFRITQKDQQTTTTQYDQIINQLIAITNSKHHKQQFSTFYHNLYLSVVFKLHRYAYLFPLKLMNLSCSPNDLLLQLVKKYKKIESLTSSINDGTKIGPLADSIRMVHNSRSKTLGRALNLAIVSIDQSFESKYIFILLTDGWSFAYAVISSKNLLYPILSSAQKPNHQSKIKVGLKLCIVDWDLFVIKNILDFHPHQDSLINNSSAIDISYNNSRLISPNSKLGCARDICFRSINKYKPGGGTIPVLEGIIVRMFSRKGASKHPPQYFTEILCGSTTYLIKFHLPEQMALSDLFSLYTCYEFRRIKLPFSKSEHNFEFYEKSSFTEISKSDRVKKVEDLLRSRLLNINKTLYQTQLYADLIVKDNKFSIGDTQFVIQQSMNGSWVLLQQYSFERRDEKSFFVRKGQRGAQVSRVPKIYSSFQYPQL